MRTQPELLNTKLFSRWVLNDMNKKLIAWTVAGIVVVIIIAVLALGHGASPQNQQAVTTNQIPAATTTFTATSSAASVYTSTADAFSAQFPGGTPIATTLTYDSPTAGTIPLIEYKMASADSVNAYYGVYVYHYPANYKFASDYLSGALTSFDDDINAKYPGTTITSKMQTQFLGSDALSATMTLPDGTEYALVTTHGQNAYIIASYGVLQSEYNAFLNSFSFTQ